MATQHRYWLQRLRNSNSSRRLRTQSIRSLPQKGSPRAKNIGTPKTLSFSARSRIAESSRGPSSSTARVDLAARLFRFCLHVLMRERERTRFAHPVESDGVDQPSIADKNRHAPAQGHDLGLAVMGPQLVKEVLGDLFMIAGQRVRKAQRAAFSRGVNKSLS